MKKTKKPTAIPVLPNARVGSIVGLLETLNDIGAESLTPAPSTLSPSQV